MHISLNTIAQWNEVFAQDLITKQDALWAFPFAARG